MRLFYLYIVSKSFILASDNKNRNSLNYEKTSCRLKDK